MWRRRITVVALFVFASVLVLLSLTALNHRGIKVAAIQRDARLKADTLSPRGRANGAEREQLPQTDYTLLRQLTPGSRDVDLAVAEPQSTLADLDKRKANDLHCAGRSIDRCFDIREQL